MIVRQPHRMMPSVTRDEFAEQLFVAQLKSYLTTRIEPALREVTKRVVEPMLRPTKDPVERRQQALQKLQQLVPYETWLCLMRSSQEMIWRFVSQCVDRQLPELKERAREIKKPRGSLRLNPDLVIPEYLRIGDTHMMPGSYFHSVGPDDLRAGAIFDRGAAIYHSGRTGAALNDARGHVVVQHLFDRFPNVKPQRILEMGCSVGNSLVAVAGYFPEAEVHGIDVGAGMLVYGHARAEHLGVAVHFSQQNAEATDFPDNSFDLVYSCALLHETSEEAVKRIIRECYRILRPGGVMIHLEVPYRYEHGDLWMQIRGEYETRYNNEPFWHGACAMDLMPIARDVGFGELAAGYQKNTSKAVPGDTGFGIAPAGAYRSWYLVSGQK